MKKGIKDYKSKTDGDLAKMIAEKRQAIRDFRFAISGSKTRNVKEGRQIKRDLARVMTEISLRKNNKNS